MADHQVTTLPNLQSILKTLNHSLCSFGECSHPGKACASCGRLACKEHGEVCVDCRGFNCEDCTAHHGCFCPKVKGDGYAGSGSDPVFDAQRHAVAEVRL